MITQSNEEKIRSEIYKTICWKKLTELEQEDIIFFCKALLQSHESTLRTEMWAEIENRKEMKSKFSTTHDYERNRGYNIGLSTAQNIILPSKE